MFIILFTILYADNNVHNTQKHFASHFSKVFRVGYYQVPFTHKKKQQRWQKMMLTRKQPQNHNRDTKTISAISSDFHSYFYTLQVVLERRGKFFFCLVEAMLLPLKILHCTNFINSLL